MRTIQPHQSVLEWYARHWWLVGKILSEGYRLIFNDCQFWRSVNDLILSSVTLTYIPDKSNENTAALKTAKVSLETAKQELKDYKDKAARILQVRIGRGAIIFSFQAPKPSPSRFFQKIQSCSIHNFL